MALALDPSVTFSSALRDENLSTHNDSSISKVSPLSTNRHSSEISTIGPKPAPLIDLSEGTILKPTLDSPSQRGKKPSTVQLLYQMMQRSHQVLQEEDVNPKLDAVRTKIENISSGQHELDIKLKNETEKAMAWERRKNVAQNFLNIAGVLLGGTAVVMGSPWTGGALLLGGLGSLAGTALDYFGFDPKITGGLSLASGVVSILGGIGSVAFPSGGLFQTISSLVTMSTGIVSGAMSAYKNQLLSQSAEYQSKSTLLETQQKLLFEKIQGALTGFKGVVDSTTKTMKALAKAGKRYNRVVAKMIS